MRETYKTLSKDSAVKADVLHRFIYTWNEIGTELILKLPDDMEIRRKIARQPSEDKIREQQDNIPLLGAFFHSGNTSKWYETYIPAAQRLMTNPTPDIFVAAASDFAPRWGWLNPHEMALAAERALRDAGIPCEYVSDRQNEFFVFPLDQIQIEDLRAKLMPFWDTHIRTRRAEMLDEKLTKYKQHPNQTDHLLFDMQEVDPNGNLVANQQQMERGYQLVSDELVKRMPQGPGSAAALTRALERALERIKGPSPEAV